VANFYKSLRILAMADVLKGEPSAEYSLRKVFRWYSEKFHTPLHIVETLPLDFVMRHHYEAQYESLIESDSALQEELRDLTMTDEEAIAAARKKDEALFMDYQFDKDVKADVARGAALAAKEKKKPKEMPTFTAPEAGTPLQMPEAKSPITMTREEEPDISMKFVDLEEMERLASSDPMSPSTDLTGLEIKQNNS
jgi:hypothetical protein